LSHHPEPPGRAVHEEVDGLDTDGQRGRRLVLLRHSHRPRRGHAPFVQAGAETSNTGVEAVKPDPRCSWKSHPEGVGAIVGDESTESRGGVRPLRIPLVIRLERRTYVVVR